MRSRIYVRGYVRRSVRRSVRPSFRRSHTSWISEKYDISTKIEPNSTKNIKLCHLKDNSETSTRADRQNAFDVWTPSDLFIYHCSVLMQNRNHVFRTRLRKRSCLSVCQSVCMSFKLFFLTNNFVDIEKKEYTNDRRQQRQQQQPQQQPQQQYQVMKKHL